VPEGKAISTSDEQKPALRVVVGEGAAKRWRDLFAGLEIAPNTKRAYDVGWRHFASWCERMGHEPLPATPEIVVEYLRAYQGRGTGHLKVASLQQNIVAITQAHLVRDLQPPTRLEVVRKEMKRIRRVHKVAPVKKRALTVADIRGIVQVLPRTESGIRDRALLLMGLTTATRRSELIALQREDVELEDPYGLRVTIRSSKTDQTGKGSLIGVLYGEKEETCPVRAYQTWIAILNAAGIKSGPVWRSIDRHGNIGANAISDRAVANIVKAAVEKIDRDPALYSGHSMRRGLATEATRNGVAEADVARQTRHKSREVLRGYIEEGSIWMNNASGSIGL
jgi:integrase